MVDGNYETIQYPDEVIQDFEVENFLTFIMQPLIWKLPILVIHLEKSKSGTITIQEANIINAIFKTINEHKRFQVRFLATDGTRSLDKLHKVSFQKYSKYILKVKKETFL